MYEWRTETRPSWIMVGGTLINLSNVNQFRQEGKDLEVHFTGSPVMTLKDVNVEEVAALIGFRKTDGDTTAKQK